MKNLIALLIFSIAYITPSDFYGLGKFSKVTIVQIEYNNGNFNPRPNSIPKLAWEVMKQTSIEMELEPKFMKLTNKELFYYPMIYFTGDGAFQPLTEKEISALRRYIINGGFMLIDSADESNGFDRTIRTQLSRAFPEKKIERIPEKFVIYKSFYLINYQGGRIIKKPWLEGIKVGKRFAVVYSQNDLAGAWARDAFGNWEFEISGGGQAQREMAFRLGVNILMYALCLDYKDDLVHAPHILERRK